MRPSVRAARVAIGLLVGVASACAPGSPSVNARPASPVLAVESRAIVRAGTSGDYPPLSLWRDEHVEGLAPALLDAFGSFRNVEVSWTRFKWPELTTDLKTGRFDVAADGITVRPERSILGRFTVPFARGGAILVLRRPSWVTTSGPTSVAVLDRPALRIGVNRGGHLERVTRSLFHAATIQAIADNSAVRAAFARGDVDAAMTNTFEAPRWAEGLSGVEQVGPLTRDITALWVRADRADLEEQLDEWLLEAEASGRLAELRRRTLGDASGGATALPLDALLAATAERLSLMPFVAAAKAREKKSLEDPAQETRVIASASELVARAATKRGVERPADARTAAFFRAQIEAAKNVQQHLPPDVGTSYALETELRSAIARISARMAWLVVRLPRTLERSEVVAKTREALADSGVDQQHLEELAVSIADLASR